VSKTEELKALCQKLGKKYVGFRGNPRAPIWLVGEAPGAEEDQAGIPFVGSSGRELDKMLHEADLSLSDCCFTNIYKIRPPNNEIERIEENGISKEIYIEQFFEELEEYRPTFIVPVGGTALEPLCPLTIDARDKESKISKWRGSLLESPRLSWSHYVLPNFHPAYVLREWSDRVVTVFVFARLKEEFDFWLANKRLQPLPSRELITEPSFPVAREFLIELLNADLPISADFELLARRVPYTLALANDIRRGISIGLFEYSPAEMLTLWRLIDAILARKRIIGQNWTTFDGNWANALGWPSGVGRCDDTLVRHHVLWPEMSHKLDFQVMQYTRQPYYKDEGKGWRLREGLKKLMRYNCLDAVCTLECYLEQEKEFEENQNLKKFYQDYEMPLARAFHKIDQRGILVDQGALSVLRREILEELDNRCVSISQRLGNRPVVYSAQMGIRLAKQLSIDPQHIFNIASVPQLKEVLKNDLKIKLRIDRKTHKESTGEESLNEAFAETSNPVLKDLLRTRELNKILGTYVDARLNANVFYSCYSVTGTVTGRRASRKTFLGYGSNGQNQPKHSDLGEKFQGVFTSRPNRIFVYCDQASAEEWIVQGIIADVSGDTKGIEELKESIRSGISRHARLASLIFNLPIEKTNDKECLEYYVGKKTRHACNYDMRENTMAAQMAAEGYAVGPKFCLAIQTKFHEVEPSIRGVYHKHIQHELVTKRFLRTPLGRERTFFGLHPNRDNGKVFREAYAYIPQSTIGDNNGLAILYCEQTRPKWVYKDRTDGVLLDGHDSTMLEVEDNFDTILEALALLKAAYNRTMRFEHGFEVQVPIDCKIGYSIKGLAKCPADLNVPGLRNIHDTLKSRQKALTSITFGPPRQESPQHSSEMST